MSSYYLFIILYILLVLLLILFLFNLDLAGLHYLLSSALLRFIVHCDFLLYLSCIQFSFRLFIILFFILLFYNIFSCFIILYIFFFFLYSLVSLFSIIILYICSPVDSSIVLFFLITFYYGH